MDVQDVQIGRVLKSYALEGLVGTGGFGAVYRARQAVVEREVAIKIIWPAFANHPNFIRRFEAEAQLVAIIPTSSAALKPRPNLSQAWNIPILCRCTITGVTLRARISSCATCAMGPCVST
jgi:serine/threonine protein kinase